MGIGPHLAARGKSHGFSRVAVGNFGIFSSYGVDVHSKRVCSVKSGYMSSYEGQLRNVN